MMLKPTKVITYLILTAFLVTGLGSLLGCILCDSGCLSDTHIASHVDDHTDNHIDVHTESYIDVHTVVYIDNNTVSLDQHFRDIGDSCFDSPIQLSKGILEQIESVETHANVAIISNRDRLTEVIDISLFVSNLTLKSPPRISQTILTHRTVVLLS